MSKSELPGCTMPLVFHVPKKSTQTLLKRADTILSCCYEIVATVDDEEFAGSMALG